MAGRSPILTLLEVQCCPWMSRAETFSLFNSTMPFSQTLSVTASENLNPATAVVATAGSMLTETFVEPGAPGRKPAGALMLKGMPRPGRKPKMVTGSKRGELGSQARMELYYTYRIANETERACSPKSAARPSALPVRIPTMLRTLQLPEGSEPVFLNL
jgi:hypothetical protein